MYICQSLCSLAEAVVLMQSVLFYIHVHHKSNTSQYRVLLYIHQNDCHTFKYRLHQNGCDTYKCKSINGHPNEKSENVSQTSKSEMLITPDRMQGSADSILVLMHVYLALTTTHYSRHINQHRPCSQTQLHQVNNCTCTLVLFMSI